MGEPGGGSQFRLTVPRTADEPLRGSPIPLEPKDSRRNRGLNDAGLPLGGTQKLATVPAQPAERAVPPMPSRDPRVAGAVDPAALPGSGARVVPRPAAETRGPVAAPEEASKETSVEAPSEDGPGAGGQSEQLKHGEGSRGR